MFKKFLILNSFHTWHWHNMRSQDCILSLFRKPVFQLKWIAHKKGFFSLKTSHFLLNRMGNLLILLSNELDIDGSNYFHQVKTCSFFIFFYLKKKILELCWDESIEDQKSKFQITNKRLMFCLKSNLSE